MTLTDDPAAQRLATASSLPKFWSAGRRLRIGAIAEESENKARRSLSNVCDKSEAVLAAWQGLGLKQVGGARAGFRERVDEGALEQNLCTTSRIMTAASPLVHASAEREH